MNLYSIKPNDDEGNPNIYYVTAGSYGGAVRRYKIRRAKTMAGTDWKDVKEPSKVVLVCDEKFLIAGRLEQ